MKKAIEMEIRAQEYSSAETTNDESTSKKRKRIPKKYLAYELVDTSKKKPKKPSKPVISSDETSCGSSDESLSEPTVTNEYTFKKSKTIKMLDCFKFSDTVTSKPAAVSTNSKSITVIDVVTVVPAGGSQSLSNSDPNIVNCDGMTSSIDTYSGAIVKRDVISDDVVSKPAAVSTNSKSITVIDVVTEIPADVSQSSSNSEANTANCDGMTSPIDTYTVPVVSDVQCFEVGDIIEFPVASCSSVNPSQSSLGNVQSTLVELLLKHISQLNSKMDVVQTKLDYVNTKLDSVTSKQDGYKTVIVDLTSKILRLEEAVELKNTQKLTLSQELSIPIDCPESFTLNETALLAKKTTTENLVTFCFFKTKFISLCQFFDRFPIFVRSTFNPNWKRSSDRFSFVFLTWISFTTKLFGVTKQEESTSKTHKSCSVLFVS